MEEAKNNKILLIAFHMSKALSVRYLANSLIKKGYDPNIIFLKSNVYDVEHLTEKEINILKEFIQERNFLFIGISILTSFTLSDVDKVIKMIKENFKIPIVIGGAFPTVMPEYCAKKCDIVMRGESEKSIVLLADAIKNKDNWQNIPGICYFNENGEYIENEVHSLVENLDEIGYPIIGYENMYLIQNNNITKGDPQLETYFYEISCSRGCPFSCSFCCSINIRRLYKNKGKYLRFRSVENVISELKEAISKNNKIKEIRFWDEVFSSEEGWIEDFSKRYKTEIGIPFHIWGHPLMIKEKTIRLLAEAGLKRIVVGIQSGSPSVRNNIFNRPETNEQIINASKILCKYKIEEVYYDLMICHPLETLKEIKETFDLCMQLQGPFRLEIHGLSFLPGSDIVDIAIKKGIYTKEEIENMFYVSYEEHIKQVYDVKYYGIEHKKEIWADLIYLTQFDDVRNKIIKLSKDPYKNEKKIHSLKKEKEESLQNIDNEQKNSIIKLFLRILKR